MSRSSSLVTVGPERAPLNCLVCGGQLFSDGFELWDPSGGYPR